MLFGPPASFNIRGGDRYAWVEYDAVKSNIDVYLSEVNSRPDSVLLSYEIEGGLSNIVGSQAYAGFTSGTGGYVDNHDIKSFSVTASTPVAPEPVSSILFLAGGAAFVIRSRFVKRKKRG